MGQPRIILAIVLSMLVIYVYYTWISPPQPPPPKPTVQEEVEEPISQPSSGRLDSGLPPVEDTLRSIPKQESKKITLENNDIEAEISDHGAVLTKWSLKKFHREATKDSPIIDLLTDQGGGEALILTLGHRDFDVQPVFSLTGEKKSGDEKTFVFTWASNNLEVRKIFTTKKEDPHLLDVQVEITNKGNQDLILDPRLWVTRKQKEGAGGGFFSFLKGRPDLYSPILYIDGKLKTEMNWEKLAQKTDISGKIYWSGLTDRYFLLGIISRQGTDNISVRYGKSGTDSVYTSLSYGTVLVRPNQTVKRLYSAYLGVKKREELKKLGVYLETSVDYGWFSFIAIPLLWLLIFFHKIVGNWGLAIIVLTVFVKLLLHPINKKSMTSMKAMQKLQPQLKEIREKYKNDKQKLNMEMMQLFKTHKVNPMGGCLPMVIQLPVYIGLYKVLWNAIELYHAPFIWFYTDLSAPDPYMISPILLGLMMVAQQKLTPTPTMDPAQQKMMMIMPIMFSVFLIFFPSGLVIYIFVNTVMSVVQQYMIHREMSFWDLIKKAKALSKKT